MNDVSMDQKGAGGGCWAIGLYITRATILTDNRSTKSFTL